ncbi:hypothetical protein CEXT_522241 [Caerostris extrusa]|uniref:Uncharacterized protein n=1 Tax=Caerostris extrusa TaxID=172846 RepID=A0AAV4WLA3_CAEEX|nr:hypothetical protein CEXT_522241 [Caerostris extrusa]
MDGSPHERGGRIIINCVTFDHSGGRLEERPVRLTMLGAQDSPFTKDRPQNENGAGGDCYYAAVADTK